MTGLDGTVYWVKDSDDYYVFVKSVGDILSTGNNILMINVKRGGEIFPSERITKKKIHQEMNRDIDDYQ